MTPATLRIVVTLCTVAFALTVIFVRLKASSRPVTVKKIVMPPIGMATGALMFVYPPTHIPFWWGLAAFAAGWLFFSYPLIRTTKFEVKGGEVFAQRSPGFAFILLGLLAVRLILHEFIQEYVSIPQTGGLFFLLAFGMITRWRLFMLKEYHLITGKQATPE
ncbi:CcdC family protein [Paenibacillus caui]|uniref:CcdC family protein n=1 Tax=Paenibacillus caui TaxID=2873927 RepID=UPI001CA7B798|nr:cytochrome c biogenesis protein CcdC [Paenibacillus caui]